MIAVQQVYGIEILLLQPLRFLAVFSDSDFVSNNLFHNVVDMNFVASSRHII